MTKSARKDFFRSVQDSLGRFLSILIISLLGVMIFAGVGTAGPDMELTADSTFDKANLTDIQVIGTLGMTEDDLAAIMRIDGVKAAEPSYQMDMICAQNGREYIVRAISLPKKINKYSIVNGRAPKAEDECVVDVEFIKATGYDIGATIQLQSGNGFELFSKLKNDQFTIVGSVKSAMFINSERGTSSIGDGKVSSFVMLPEEAFDMDSYSVINVTVEGAKELNCYSKEYDEKISTVIDKIKEIADVRCSVRYDEVKAKTDDYLARADEEYQNGKSTAQKKLDEAYKKLKDANQAIVDGRNELADKEEQITKAEEVLQNIDVPIAQAKAYLETARKKVNDAQEAYDNAVKAVPQMRKEIEKQKEELAKMGDTDEAKGKAVSIAAAELYADQLEKSLPDKKAELDGYKKDLAKAEKQMTEYEAQIELAKSAVVEIKSQIEIAKTKIEEAETELEYGKQEYSLARKDIEQELADAEKQLENARDYINNLSAPEWYVLDRSSIPSCASLDEDIHSLKIIATFFPIFFFIVATLVALTTMTRMVEEERTLIGTYKALGYSNRSIASKYICYAFLACSIGSVAGFMLGEKLVPKVVLRAYSVSYYGLGAPVIPYNVVFAVASCATAVICICFATYFACRRSLKSTSAALMRPEAPKGGKRILLERITFIWARLSFNQKAAMRNLFRYKKRFFMTVFGVGGCMALLLVAFGIGDSVRAMSEKQYNEIFTYDFTLGYESDIDRTNRRELMEVMGYIETVEDRTQVLRSINYFTVGDESYSGYLVVPEDLSKFPSFVHLRNRTTLEEIPLGNTGVVISEKLAELLGIGVGDNITIKTSENDASPKTVPVAAITENYVLHYVYMSPELYEKVYNISVPFNSMYVKANVENETLFVAELMILKGVSSASTIAAERTVVDAMATNLNAVVYVLIGAAALLAFIVLYNLNNININERRRELATIKLLGFYNKELAGYIYRENVMLTFIGIAIGTVAGIFLHRFIMRTAESDMIMLGRQLNWQSFVISIALSLFFALLVNLFMYRKFRKIDMVESLKSVE
ncbi:MAG: FtsX-like permease family protein [Clostridiales bacterium]|nr:FtsX-like permease family protein [Clostridiales bacterium]